PACRTSRRRGNVARPEHPDRGGPPVGRPSASRLVSAIGIAIPPCRWLETYRPAELGVSENANPQRVHSGQFVTRGISRGPLQSGHHSAPRTKAEGSSQAPCLRGRTSTRRLRVGGDKARSR